MVGAYELFCNGDAIRCTKHGIRTNVKGHGDFGCQDRFLDVPHHVAMDIKTVMEPFP